MIKNEKQSHCNEAQLPIAKSVKSSRNLINDKRNTFQYDNVFKYACIPEIEINIIGRNKNGTIIDSKKMRTLKIRLRISKKIMP